MKSKIFTLRFNTEQFSTLSNEAYEYGMNTGELIRYKLGFESKTNTRQVIFLLNKTSNNINQIAKALNIANLANRLDNFTYTQALSRLAIVKDDFKSIYNLIKEIKNAN